MYIVWILFSFLFTLTTRCAAMSAELHVPITDLTADEFGDINLWIGKGKRYQNVPEYVSKELCCRTSALQAEESLALLPSSLLPVSLLLDFPIPPIKRSLKGI